MRKTICFLIPLVVVVIVLSQKPAHAIKEFQEQFMEQYYKPKSKEPNEKKLAEEIDKVSETKAGVMSSCNVCHVDMTKNGRVYYGGGKPRNSYGNELEKLLDKKTDKADKKKIKEALEKVGGMKSPGGPTYDELMKKGALPGSEDKEEKKK